jgi:hypothetical protein
LSVVEQVGEFKGKATAKSLCRCVHLLFHDEVENLLLTSSVDMLLGKLNAYEVEHNIGQRLQIIATRLLDTLMCVDAGIYSISNKIFPYAVWNVVTLPITILLRPTETDDKDLVTSRASSDQETLGTDATVEV